MKRRGFTVIEIVVALAIAVNLLIVLWGVFTADQRRFSADQSRLTALQGALLIEEYLRNDLDRVVTDLPDAAAGDAAFSINRPVEITDQGRTLKLQILDPARAEAGGVRLVTYRLEPGGHRISRTEGDRTRHLPTVPIEDVRFSLVSLTPKPEAVSPDTQGLPRQYPVHMVKYQVICSGEPDRGGAELAGKERRVCLVSAVAIRHRLDRLHHDYWMPSAYDHTDRIPR